MEEACGPVQINTGERFYIGATRVTNNTAEMQGVIEALFWLNTCVEQGALQAANDVLITVDSLHVKGLIEEKFVARENKVLATLLRHTWNSLDTRTYRRRGEHHRRSPGRCWHAPGTTTSVVATDTVEWRMGRGGFY